MNDYLQQILTISQDEIKNGAFNNETLAAMQNSITQWLEKKEALDQRLKNIYDSGVRRSRYTYGDRKQDIDITSAGLKTIVKKYEKQKKDIAELQNLNEITEHAQNGYRLVHKIRDIITKQEIEYSILYQDKNNKLLETKITMEQILPQNMITNLNQIENVVTTNKKGITTEKKLSNAISLQVTNAAIKQLGTIGSQIDKPDLWDDLVVLQNRILQLKDSKLENQFGHLYEAYYAFRHIKKYQSINRIGDSDFAHNTINLGKALSEQKLGAAAQTAVDLLTASDKNVDKGWQIGDFGTTQLKAVFNSSAKLIGMGTIENVLKQVQEALQSKNAEGLSNALQQIYTTNRTTFNNEIDRLAEEEAIKNIKETVKGINFDSISINLTNI
jgi:hypothetical protein